MKPLLSPSSTPHIAATWAHLDEFGNAGLRTLVCAYATLSDEAYEAWHQEFVNAKNAIENREAQVMAVGT